MVTLPAAEIKALVRLLKSDDENTTKLLFEQLKTFDVTLLRDIDREISPEDINLRKRFLNHLLRSRRESLKEEFLKWAKSKVPVLEEGIYLIAQFNNPLVDISCYSKILGKWAEELSEKIKNVKLPGDPTSVINEVNHFLFMELGFRGNKKDYHEPDNSFIDRVIERRLGNPILLSSIYLLITNKIGLPFKGVSMPAHFLVQYTESFGAVLVDPFNGGEILTKDVCKERVKKLNLTWHEDYLETPNNKQIILRMMQNLINIYQNEGEVELKEYLGNYVAVVNNQS